MKTLSELEAMTDDKLRVMLAELAGTADRWHLVKRGLFYRPDAHGYTQHSHEAWILTKEQAKTHEYKRGDASCDWITIVQAPLPNYPEDLNACHTVIESLSKQGPVEFQGSRYTNLRSVFAVKLLSVIYGEEYHWSLAGPSSLDVFNVAAAKPRSVTIALILTFQKP